MRAYKNPKTSFFYYLCVQRFDHCKMRKKKKKEYMYLRTLKFEKLSQVYTYFS
jgi:hypothetical protein